jgi:hypothetical protein
MKNRILRLTASGLLSAALLALAACSSTSQPPPAVGSASVSYRKGEPGGVIVQTFKMTATVSAIDQAQRKATLLRPDGLKVTVKAAPGAVNFDQLRVGDHVAATVTERVVASVVKAGTAAGQETTAAAAQDAPGGQAAETTQVTARVIAIDLEKRTATLRFADGGTETLHVRDDLDLSRQKVGQQVVFRLTEMTALWIEKAPY